MDLILILLILVLILIGLVLWRLFHKGTIISGGAPYNTLYKEGWRTITGSPLSVIRKPIAHAYLCRDTVNMLIFPSANHFPWMTSWDENHNILMSHGVYIDRLVYDPNDMMLYSVINFIRYEINNSAIIGANICRLIHTLPTPPTSSSSAEPPPIIHLPDLNICAFQATHDYENVNGTYIGQYDYYEGDKNPDVISTCKYVFNVIHNAFHARGVSIQQVNLCFTTKFKDENYNNIKRLLTINPIREEHAGGYCNRSIITALETKVQMGEKKYCIISITANNQIEPTNEQTEPVEMPILAMNGRLETIAKDTISQQKNVLLERKPPLNCYRITDEDLHTIPSKPYFIYTQVKNTECDVNIKYYIADVNLNAEEITADRGQQEVTIRYKDMFNPSPSYIVEDPCSEEHNLTLKLISYVSIFKGINRIPSRYNRGEFIAPYVYLRSYLIKFIESVIRNPNTAVLNHPILISERSVRDERLYYYIVYNNNRYGPFEKYSNGTSEADYANTTPDFHPPPTVSYPWQPQPYPYNAYSLTGHPFSSTPPSSLGRPVLSSTVPPPPHLLHPVSPPPVLSSTVPPHPVLYPQQLQTQPYTNSSLSGPSTTSVPPYYPQPHQ